MADFNILDHLDALTSDGGSEGKNERSYQCPVCNATNFKVTIAGPKEGQYFTRGCSCMDTDAGKQSIIDAISPRWEKPARAKSSQTFTYEILNDTTPISLVQVRRNDDGQGKRKFSQWHKADGKWVTGFPEELRDKVHLYRIFDKINQNAIANSELVLLVEGEGLVHDLHKLGIAATCSIGGGGKWTEYGYPNYLKDLDGAIVIICPDRDVPGMKHAELIAKDFPDAPWLYANPTSFRWDQIPETKGFDLGDWIEDGATKEQILGAIEPRRIPTTQEEKPKSTTKKRPKPDDDDDEKSAKRAIADQLIDIGRESNVSYFVTPEDIVFADVMDAETRFTLAIREKAFKQYLRSKLFDKTEKSPGSEAVQQAIDTLEALAVRKPEKRPVFVRLAGYDDRIYIDLADESWKSVEVSCDGWRVVSDAPCRFMRGASAPLPIPIEGGDVQDFKNLCQFDDDTWALILAFLIQALKPEKGYPILLLHGGPDAGKSTLTRAIKCLIDPATSKSRKSVGEIRDFAIHATRRHVITIDNLSGMSADQSDILCTSSTGGGHSQRALHTDSGETTFNFCNLLILNGIDSIATRGDLLSRSFPVTIHPPKNRLSEADFEERLESMRPAVFGALLTILSKILAILPTVKGSYVGGRERFMGFVELGLALEQVMSWEPGIFLRVLGETRDDAHETAIESSPVGQAIQELMHGRDVWTGTMGHLLENLQEMVSDQVKRSKFFPQDATRLSKTLIRLTPDLKALGIHVTTEKKKHGKLVTLERMANLAPPASPASQPSQGKALMGDAKFADDASVTLLPQSSKKGDAKSPTGDATKKPASSLKPSQHKAGDAGDAGDAKKRAISPDAKTDLGEWEISEEIAEYEYIADDK